MPYGLETGIPLNRGMTARRTGSKKTSSGKWGAPDRVIAVVGTVQSPFFELVLEIKAFAFFRPNGIPVEFSASERAQTQIGQGPKIRIKNKFGLLQVAGASMSTRRSRR
jgi:hypothetical protein